MALAAIASAGCGLIAPAAPTPSALQIPQEWSASLTSQKAASPAAPVTPLAAWWRRFDDVLLVSLIDNALEVEQARAATAQTRAQIPLLQTAAAQAEHALAVLTWRAPAALRDRLAATTAVPIPADDLVLAFPADTLRQRPDVRAAEARGLASAERVRQADAARLPTFPLSGSLGLGALTLGTLTNSAAVVASLLVSVSAPLFDGGAARAQLRAQRAALLQSARDAVNPHPATAAPAEPAEMELV